MLLAARVASGADVHVVATSGTTVSGVGIARFFRPQEGVGGAVVFLGMSTTLGVLDPSGARTTLLTTGDALPPPLRGTVNEITQGIVAGSFAGSFVGILADTNGP